MKLFKDHPIEQFIPGLEVVVIAGPYQGQTGFFRSLETYSTGGSIAYVDLDNMPLMPIAPGDLRERILLYSST